MTPERWAQVKAILARAIETPPAERDALLDRACAGDAELRAEVASLLAADARADDGDDASGSRAAIASAARRALGARLGHASPPPDALAAHDDRALRDVLETALGRQYEIVRSLGRGGMGAVYLAREHALERFVAIKVLRPDLALAPESRERFRREARIAAQLSHPGILPLHTFGEVQGVWYFVMGYVRGASLAERLRVEGRLPSGEAHRILAELADALECAHRNGVVHRDIKPANVLLDDETGRAVLADFGISKVQGAGDSLTATGVVVGTPHFMSPEQSLGAPTVDERSDLYSLGAVGYTMLAGREPFAETDARELTYRRLSHDPAPLRSVAPWVPPDLAAVVTRCLEREPAARWPSARSLKEALARAGGDPAAAALPESLRDLPTFGPYALLWAAAWTALAARALHSAGDRALLLLVALIVPFGFMLHLWNVGRHGPGALGLVRVAFWPPEWWGMWWPRALRRPADLWPRLPRAARLVRGILSALIVALPALILAREGAGPAIAMPAWFVAAEGAIVASAAAVIAAALWWARRRGLHGAEVTRVLFGATMPSPGWSAPRVARLLGAPATGGVRAPDRDAPADHRRAIGDLAPLLPETAGDVGALAARAAHRLLVAIEACDAEIVALAHDANAGELDRLTAQLGALERDTVAADASPERRELLALVRRQLDVVRRMRVRCELLSQRRTRLFTLMRGLWTQLCLVRDTAADDEPAVSATAVARVRALCDEIARELDAAAVPAPDVAYFPSSAVGPYIEGTGTSTRRR